MLLSTTSLLFLAIALFLAFAETHPDVFHDGPCPSPPEAAENIQLENFTGVWLAYRSNYELLKHSLITRQCIEVKVITDGENLFTTSDFRDSYSNNTQRSKKFVPVEDKPGSLQAYKKSAPTNEIRPEIRIQRIRAYALFDSFYETNEIPLVNEIPRANEIPLVNRIPQVNEIPQVNGIPRVNMIPWIPRFRRLMGFYDSTVLDGTYEPLGWTYTIIKVQEGSFLEYACKNTEENHHKVFHRIFVRNIPISQEENDELVQLVKDNGDNREMLPYNHTNCEYKFHD
uniref:Lipocalin/cytosolic fatty-acid binding domain-containing protein n=1 Tax=Strigamia maritima TaxID=126957 RepID=T1J002_STRMM